MKISSTAVFLLLHVLVILADARPGSQPNAWRLSDVSSEVTGPGGGYGVFGYQTTLSPAHQTDASTKGWRYTVVSRLVKGSAGAGPAQSMSYDSFRVSWDADASGRLNAILHVAGTTDLTFPVTASGQATNAYHRHELVYDSGTRKVSYLFDGATVGQVTANPAATAQLGWGASSLPGQGTMNYHLIQFAIGGRGVVAQYSAGFSPSLALTPSGQGWNVFGPGPLLVNLGVGEGPDSPDTVQAAGVDAYRMAVLAEPSLVGFYPVDGDLAPTLTDRRLLERNGTLSDNATFAGGAGTVGTASLQGGHVNLGSVSEYQFSDGFGTVEAFLFQTDTTSFNPCFFACRSADSRSRYSLHGDTRGSALYCWNGTNVATFPTPLNMLNRLVHVAFVFSNQTVRAYFDGQLLGLATFPLGALGQPCQIGAATPTNTEPWVGRIDEVAVYTNAQSAGSITKRAVLFLDALNANYTTGSEVPLTIDDFDGFTPTGHTVNLRLDYAPIPGTTLTLVRNTGLNLIQGRFENLYQGQRVALSHGGTTYEFLANYFGGSGRDVVLQLLPSSSGSRILVTTTQPNGAGSLRQAILRANASAGATVIELATNAVYTLIQPDNYWYGPNALPPITSDVTIEGHGATLFINTATRLRCFYVGADPTATGTLGFHSPGPGRLTLRELTLAGGRQKGGDSTDGGGGAGMGGAIFNQGQLTLEGVTLRDNRALGGASGVAGLGGSGGGLGSDSFENAGTGHGGGFGGEVIPPGSRGAYGEGVANSYPLTYGGSGGGGGGFGPADHGGRILVESQGGGAADGLGGSDSTNSSAGSSGFGSGGGGRGVGKYASPGATGGNFGSGGDLGFAGGGGGVGGGGGRAIGSTPSNGFPGGGSGGFGGGGAMGGSGGFGGGSGGVPNQDAGVAPDPAGGPGFGGGTGRGASVPGAWVSRGGAGGGFGGAIFNHGGQLTILSSTLSGNTATGGAGIRDPLLDWIPNVTPSNTGGSGLGGAIFNLNGTVTLRFSTLASNSVATGSLPDAAARALGGAVYNLAYSAAFAHRASLTLDHCLLANNNGGADLANNAHGSLITEGLNNLVNRATTQVRFIGANLVTASTNLDGGTTSGPLPRTNPPLLGALRNNGGPTLTHALLPGSPAIDAGDPSFVPPPTFDQRGRGFWRLDGARVDLGSVESQLTPLSPWRQWLTANGLLFVNGLGALDDPDGDGYPNVLEFAFGGNPFKSGDPIRTRVVLARLDGLDRLTYTFPCRTGAVFNGAQSVLTTTVDGLTYEVRGRADLKPGSSRTVLELDRPLSEGLPPLSPGWGYRTFRLADGVPGTASGFLRLNVELAP